jgi:flagellar biosynthesis/type III secretory pathway protein FliH
MKKGKEEGKKEGIIKGKEEGIIEGKEEGIIEGEEKGREKAMITVAKKMKEMKRPVEEIAKLTNIPKEKIMEL